MLLTADGTRLEQGEGDDRPPDQTEQHPRGRDVVRLRIGPPGLGVEAFLTHLAVEKNVSASTREPGVERAALSL